MFEATVCHLLRGSGNDKEVLLGQRSGLFCNGIWNGPGGKLKPGETILSCLKREVLEEIGIRVKLSSVEHFATVDFYHKYGRRHKLEWRVHYFSAIDWKGELRSIREFSKLDWFPLRNLPYEQMMADQRVWLPLTFISPPGKLLAVKIFYADEHLKAVEKGFFRFIDIPL